MGAFRCPNCQATVTADSPVGLVCPRCGYGGTSPPAAVPAESLPPATGYVATQPLPTAGIMEGTGPMCPRCHSMHTKKGGIPVWAIICTVVGFFIVFLLSLLFLLAKEESQCFNCGMRWKA